MSGMSDVERAPSRPASPTSGRELSALCGFKDKELVFPCDDDGGSHDASASASGATATGTLVSHDGFGASVGARAALHSARRSQRLVDEMRDVALSGDDELVGLADAFWLRASLSARDGDVQRSLWLARRYLVWRRDTCYGKWVSKGLPGSVVELLAKGVFTIAGNTSRDGAPVLSVRAERIDPARSEPRDMLLALAVLLEHLLRSRPPALARGVALVVDARGARAQGGGMRMAGCAVRFVAGVFPARVGTVVVVGAGRVLRAAVRMAAPFVAGRGRVVMVEAGERGKMMRYFEPKEVPTWLDVGGTLEWTPHEQRQLAADVVEKCARWPKGSSCKGAS